MTKDTHVTTVIFRKQKVNGDIVAIFPEEPESGLIWRYCACFCVNEGHGGADPQWIIEDTTPATREESEATRRALIDVYGYVLGPASETINYDAIRRKAWHSLMNAR